MILVFLLVETKFLVYATHDLIEKIDMKPNQYILNLILGVKYVCTIYYIYTPCSDASRQKKKKKNPMSLLFKDNNPYLNKKLYIFYVYIYSIKIR